MIKLPEPDDTWSPSEVHDILLAYSTGQLVPKTEDERLQITIKDSGIWFRGYCVGQVFDNGVSCPATIRDAFLDLLLGLDTE